MRESHGVVRHYPPVRRVKMLASETPTAPSIQHEGAHRSILLFCAERVFKSRPRFQAGEVSSF